MFARCCYCVTLTLVAYSVPGIFVQVLLYDIVHRCLFCLHTIRLIGVFIFVSVDTVLN